VAKTRLQFGVLAMGQASFPDLLSVWQAAESAGFDSAWVVDHFSPPTGPGGSPFLECWTTLTALAAKTSGIRLGTMTLANSYRHPALVAKMAATLDVISGGRLELGIGAGWLESEYRAYGFPFPSAAQRIAQMSESVQMMKALWTDRLVSFQGKHFTLVEASCEPKPVQKPHPPIWVGGSGEKLTMRVVAERADGWNVTVMPEDEFKRKLDILREHCAAVGRDPDSIRKSMLMTTLISDDKAKLTEMAAAMAARRGVAVEQLAQRTLIGAPDEVAARLKAYADLGVDLFIFGLGQPSPVNALELLAKRVINTLR